MTAAFCDARRIFGDARRQPVHSGLLSVHQRKSPANWPARGDPTSHLQPVCMAGAGQSIGMAQEPRVQEGIYRKHRSPNRSNKDFRRVLYTGNKLQLVLMVIEPGQDIGEEVHDDVDQFFRVEKGKGEVRIDGVATPVKSDDAFIVPAGAKHNVVNNWQRASEALHHLCAP